MRSTRSIQIEGFPVFEPPFFSLLSRQDTAEHRASSYLAHLHQIAGITPAIFLLEIGDTKNPAAPIGAHGGVAC